MNHINRTQDLDQARATLQRTSGHLERHPGRYDSAPGTLRVFFIGAIIIKKPLLIMLDSMEAHPVTPEFAIFAAQLNHKLSSLMIGNPPPRFSLPDLEGKSVFTGGLSGQVRLSDFLAHLIIMVA